METVKSISLYLEGQMTPEQAVLYNLNFIANDYVCIELHAVPMNSY